MTRQSRQSKVGLSMFKHIWKPCSKLPNTSFRVLAPSTPPSTLPHNVLLPHPLWATTTSTRAKTAKHLTVWGWLTVHMNQCMTCAPQCNLGHFMQFSHFSKAIGSIASTCSNQSRFVGHQKRMESLCQEHFSKSTLDRRWQCFWRQWTCNWHLAVLRFSRTSVFTESCWSPSHPSSFAAAEKGGFGKSLKLLDTKPPRTT